MKTEIETKVKVDSLEAVEARLEELGAVFACDLCQADAYFDDAENTLIESDRGLRIRKETTDDSERTILTYKGPRQATQLKTRQEIEIRLDGETATMELLEALGYKKIIAFEKKRGLWRMDECEICLDELPLLGSFVEIEGPGQTAIANVTGKLGLDQLPHIDESYAVMMRSKIADQQTG